MREKTTAFLFVFCIMCLCACVAHGDRDIEEKQTVYDDAVVEESVVNENSPLPEVLAVRYCIEEAPVIAEPRAAELIEEYFESDVSVQKDGVYCNISDLVTLFKSRITAGQTLLLLGGGAWQVSDFVTAVMIKTEILKSIYPKAEFLPRCIYLIICENGEAEVLDDAGGIIMKLKRTQGDVTCGAYDIDASIEIDGEVAPEILQALCAHYGINERLPDIAIDGAIYAEISLRGNSSQGMTGVYALLHTVAGSVELSLGDSFGFRYKSIDGVQKIALFTEGEKGESEGSEEATIAKSGLLRTMLRYATIRSVRLRQGRGAIMTTTNNVMSFSAYYTSADGSQSILDISVDGDSTLIGLSDIYGKKIATVTADELGLTVEPSKNLLEGSKLLKLGYLILQQSKRLGSAKSNEGVQDVKTGYTGIKIPDIFSIVQRVAVSECGVSVRMRSSVVGEFVSSIWGMFSDIDPTQNLSDVILSEVVKRSPLLARLLSVGVCRSVIDVLSRELERLIPPLQAVVLVVG